MNAVTTHAFDMAAGTNIPDEGRSTPLTSKDIALIRDVPVRLTARLGSATLTVEKLFKLTRGDIVELEEMLDDAVVFYMGDKPIARGNLVAVGDNYGIQLTEIA